MIEVVLNINKEICLMMINIMLLYHQ